jgi:hypothetical protein
MNSSAKDETHPKQTDSNNMAIRLIIILYAGMDAG